VVLAVLVTARSTEFWSGQAARCVPVLLDGSLLPRHGDSLPVSCWAERFQLMLTQDRASFGVRHVAGLQRVDHFHSRRGWPPVKLTGLTAMCRALLGCFCFC